MQLAEVVGGQLDKNNSMINLVFVLRAAIGIELDGHIIESQRLYQQ
jgi:hypothetical protein